MNTTNETGFLPPVIMCGLARETGDLPDGLVERLGGIGNVCGF